MHQVPSTASHQAWEKWQEASKIYHKDSTFGVLELLRRTYPDHIVTMTREKVGLIEFAAAKLAEAVLDEEEERFVFEREYEATDRRSSIEHGKLDDDLKFGKFWYSWNGHEFIVYYLEFTVSHLQPTRERLYFILYERSKAGGEARPKVVDELIATSTKWNEGLHEEIYMFNDDEWTKNKKLYKSVQQAKWDDVVLDPRTKNTLINDVVGFFDKEAEYHAYAAPFKRGIILHGPPGNGKSLCIKALSHSLSTRPDPIPTLYVKSIHGTCGQMEWYNIRQIFEKARDTAPCLLIFEDLDSLVTDEVRSFFLNEVDGLEDNEGLLIIGSTNHLEKLDTSITNRPSRFDRKYHFASPGHAERVMYADYWGKKITQNEKLDYPDGLSDAIASITDGFSFAYLKETFISSLLSTVGPPQAETPETEASETAAAAEGEEANGSDITIISKDEFEQFADLPLWRTIRTQVEALRREMKGDEESGSSGKETKKAEKDADGEEEAAGEGGQSVKALVKTLTALVTELRKE